VAPVYNVGGFHVVVSIVSLAFSPSVSRQSIESMPDGGCDDCKLFGRPSTETGHALMINGTRVHIRAA